MTPAEISAYLNCETTIPAKADFIFVTGTQLPDPIPHAINLYRQDIAPYIVLTGGKNRHTGVNEANRHRELLLEAGIPDSAIILENKSTNTLENVAFAKPLMAEKKALDAIGSIVLVAKWMHSRRALMTLKKHLPDGIRYYCKTYHPKGITPDNWHVNDVPQVASIGKNIKDIPFYLEKGDIAEIQREGDYFI